MPKLQKCDFLGRFLNTVFTQSVILAYSMMCAITSIASQPIKQFATFLFILEKKIVAYMKGGILGKYRISFCTTPRDSVDHYFSLYERRFVSWNLNKSLKRAIQETLDAGIRISFSLLFLFCCLI